MFVKMNISMSVDFEPDACIDVTLNSAVIGGFMPKFKKGPTGRYISFYEVYLLDTLHTEMSHWFIAVDEKERVEKILMGKPGLKAKVNI